MNLHDLYEDYLNVGTYMSIKPVPESIELVWEHLSDKNIKDMISLDKLHVTLIHSRDTPFLDLKRNDILHEAIITGYKILGDGKWAAMVLMLDSPSLKMRHENLKSHGLNHSYPNYNCHMSIKYQPNPLDYCKLQSSRLVGNKLYFRDEYSDTIEG